MASLPAKRKPGNSGEKPKAAETKRREKAEAVAERKRLERERKNEKVERERLERKLRIAQGVLEARKEEILRLKEKLAEAEDSVEGARAVVREAEKLLVELDRVTRA
jgi:chromosome segregation ATPase